MSIEDFVKEVQNSNRKDIKGLEELFKLLQTLKDLQKEEQEVYETSVMIN